MHHAAGGGARCLATDGAYRVRMHTPRRAYMRNESSVFAIHNLVIAHAEKGNAFFANTVQDPVRSVNLINVRNAFWTSGNNIWNVFVNA